MKNCGVDLGSKSSAVTIIGKRGQILLQTVIPTTRDGLNAFFGQRPSMHVHMEAGEESCWIARHLEALGHDPQICDPNQAKAIGWSKLKHNRVDSELLARLGQSGLLVPVFRRDERTDRLRAELRIRAGLVRTRADFSRRIKSVWRQYGLKSPTGKVHQLVVAIRGSLPVDPSLRELLEPLLQVHDELSRHIQRLDEKFEQVAATDPVVRRLDGVPGIGPINAVSFCAAVEDPARFRNARAVGCYFGLVPRENSTGETRRLGSITRHGDREMRWLLVQGAHSVLNTRSDSALRQWGLTLARKKGRAKAVVALARKLAIVMWTIWKTEQDYQRFPASSRRRPSRGRREFHAGSQSKPTEQ